MIQGNLILFRCQKHASLDLNAGSLWHPGHIIRVSQGLSTASLVELLPFYHQINQIFHWWEVFPPLGRVRHIDSTKSPENHQNAYFVRTIAVVSVKTICATALKCKCCIRIVFNCPFWWWIWKRKSVMMFFKVSGYYILYKVTDTKIVICSNFDFAWMNKAVTRSMTMIIHIS